MFFFFPLLHLVKKKNITELLNFGQRIVFFLLCVCWLNTLDMLNILCVGLKLGTSFNQAWAEHWGGQTNTRRPLKANWTLWYHREKREKVGRRLRLQYMDCLFLLQLIKCSCQTVYAMVTCVFCPRWAPIEEDTGRRLVLFLQARQEISGVCQLISHSANSATHTEAKI